MTTTRGDLLRTEGQAQATHAADPRRTATIDRLIREAAASGERFSANSIRDRVPVVSRGLVGARIDAARKRGELEPVGWTKSTLPSTRSHRIVVWRGKPETGSIALPLAACLALLVAALLWGSAVLSPLAAVAGALAR